MGEIFFVIKTLIFTVAVVLLMQIKIGGRTIEKQTLSLIQDSAVTDNLRLVAAGAVVAAQKGYETVSSIVTEDGGKPSKKGRPSFDDEE